MNLKEWMKQFEGQFDDRALGYMTVHKANIVAQLQDSETREIHLHQLEYKAKNAYDLRVEGTKSSRGKNVMRDGGETIRDFFKDVEMIFEYSRKQALEDGVLVDMSAAAREAGIRYPVAVTQAVFTILNDTRVSGQDLSGRTWDMLMIFRTHIRAASGDEIHFAPLFLMEDGAKPEPVPMWAKCGPGDTADPVITILLENQD
ncbi:MAG: DUF6573 family protein [Candidatus Omnitrophota bacterium]